MDPITLDICWNRLIGVVNEQAAALMRTSFTSIVREAGDSAFHFHAALNEFQFLDGKMFATPQAAQAAADAGGAVATARPPICA